MSEDFGGRAVGENTGTRFEEEVNTGGWQLAGSGEEQGGRAALAASWPSTPGLAGSTAAVDELPPLVGRSAGEDKIMRILRT